MTSFTEISSGPGASACPRQSPTLILLSYFAFLISLTFLFWKVFHGVDLSDESWYSAHAYRLYLGEVPFRDDITIAQGAPLLLVPLLKLFFLWSPSTDGIVLYIRLLYVILVLAVASMIFTYLRRYLTKEVSLSLASLYVVFIPFCLPSVSYDTVGVAFMLMGFLLAPLGEKETSDRGTMLRALFAGLLHSVALCAYPPFLFALLVVPVLTLFSSPAKSRRILAYLIGVGFFPILIAAIYKLTFRDVLGALAATHALNPGTSWPNILSNKIPSTLHDFAHLYWSVGMMAAGIAFLVLGVGLESWKSKRLSPFYLALAVPLLLGWHYRSGGRATTHALVVDLALFGIIVIWLDPQVRQRMLPLFLRLWVGTFLLGFLMASFSANGFTTAGVGMMGGAIATWCFLYQSLQARYGATSAPAACCAGIWLTILIFIFLGRHSYGEADIRSLQFRVDKGPFKGLRTTESKKRLCESLQADLAREAMAGSRLHVFPAFASAYLIGDMLPVARSIFFQMPTEKALSGMPRTGEKVVVLLVRRLYGFVGTEYYDLPEARDELAWLEGHCELSVKRLDYAIFHCQRESP